jgi:hypothetical protein
MRANAIASLKLGATLKILWVRDKSIDHIGRLVASERLGDLASLERDEIEIIQSLRFLKFVTENRALFGDEITENADIQLGILIVDDTLIVIITNHPDGHAQMQAMRFLMTIAQKQGRSPESSQAEVQLAELLSAGRLRDIVSAAPHPDLAALCLRSINWVARDGSPHKDAALAERQDWIETGILDAAGKLPGSGGSSASSSSLRIFIEGELAGISQGCSRIFKLWE